MRSLGLLVFIACAATTTVTVDADGTDSSSSAVAAGAFTNAVQRGLAGETKELSSLLEVDATLVSAALSNTGATALHYAAAKGLVEMTQLLLTHGAKVNRTDWSGGSGANGETALHYAAGECATPVVKLLLEHKADVNLQQTCSPPSSASPH